MNKTDKLWRKRHIQKENFWFRFFVFFGVIQVWLEPNVYGVRPTVCQRISFWNPISYLLILILLLFETIKGCLKGGWKAALEMLSHVDFKTERF